jgi:hypothetical protein
VVGVSHFFGDLQCRLISLSIKVGVVVVVVVGFVLGSKGFLVHFWLPRMDTGFDIVLDDIRGTSPNFDCSSFTSKDIIPPKTNHVLASALFSKSVQDMKVKFDMTTR